MNIGKKTLVNKICKFETFYQNNPEVVPVNENYEKNFSEACCRYWALNNDINKSDIVDILCDIGNYSIDESCQIIALYWKSKSYTLKKYGLIPIKMKWDEKFIRPLPGLEEWRNLQYNSNDIKISSPPGFDKIYPPLFKRSFYSNLFIDMFIINLYNLCLILILF
jgi:hypothetical protein